LHNQFVVCKVHILNNVLLISYKDFNPVFFLGMENIHGDNSTSWVFVVCSEKEICAVIVNKDKFRVPLVDNW